METGTSKVSKCISVVLAWTIYSHWVFNPVKHWKSSCAVQKSKIKKKTNKQQKDKNQKLDQS